MLKIGFWTDEPRLILEAEEPHDLIRLGEAIRGIVEGEPFKVPGPEGYALVGVSYLEIGSGSDEAKIIDTSIILALPTQTIADMAEKIEHMVRRTAPCHNYVDLRDITIIVSLGEGRLRI